MDKYTTKTCKTHGDTTFVLEGRGYYRCKQCRVDAVQRRRVKVKQQLVAHHGGVCADCSQAYPPPVFEFHHLDPDGKDFNPASGGKTLSYARQLKETEKCVMLCANCHRMRHYA